MPKKLSEDINSLQKRFDINMKFMLPHKTKGIKFALAISGGSDSMCMLEIAKNWSNENQSVIHAVTVNHKLRNFDKEIELISKACKINKINFTVLDWKDGIKIRSNIQGLARKARYKLISDFCKQQDILYLLTAHNMQDATENFFIKTIRKAGVQGLLNNEISIINGLVILRPFFNFSKEECINFLNEKKLSWVEDPTNKSPKFLRNKIRLALTKIEDFQDNFSRSVMSTVNHLKSSYSVLQDYFLDSFIQTTVISRYGHAVINLSLAKGLNIGILRMILYQTISIVRGTDKLPRMAKINYILDKIYKEESEMFVSTLHGCRIYKNENIVWIYRLLENEVDRNLVIEQSSLEKNKSFNWDDRFNIHLSGEIKTPVKISSFALQNKNATDATKLLMRIKKIDCIFSKNNFPKKYIKEFLHSIPIAHFSHSLCISTTSEEDNEIIFSCLDYQLTITCKFSPIFKFQNMHKKY